MLINSVWYPDIHIYPEFLYSVKKNGFFSLPLSRLLLRNITFFNWDLLDFRLYKWFYYFIMVVIVTFQVGIICSTICELLYYFIKVQFNSLIEIRSISLLTSSLDVFSNKNPSTGRVIVPKFKKKKKINWRSMI